MSEGIKPQRGVKRPKMDRATESSCICIQIVTDVTAGGDIAVSGYAVAAGKGGA